MKGIRMGVVIALVGILAGGGGAYAAGQITGAQIKDGTITAKDIKKGSLSTTNLSAAARKGMQGPAGPAGPAGAKGDTGPTVFGSAGTPGPKGDKGDPGAKGDKGDKGEAGGFGEVTEEGVTVPNGTSDEEWVAEAVVTCPDGQRVISGGYIQDFPWAGVMPWNVASDDGTSWLFVSLNLGDPDDPDPELAEGDLLAFAYCVESPEASKVPYAQRHAAALQQVQAISAKTKHQRRR